MNFWQIFFRVFPWRPLPALVAFWWYILGRRLRARNRLRLAGASLPFAYQFWMRNFERSSELEKQAAFAVQTWAWKPKFLVILDARDCTVENILKSIGSVEGQAYTHWMLVVVGPESDLFDPCKRFTSSWKAALDENSCEFVVPLRGGNQLSKWCLFYFAEVLQSERGASIVYGDEDEIDSIGQRRKPWFKPRWNEELFLARDFISRACAIRATSARAAAVNTELVGRVPVLELLLLIIQRNEGPIVHVARVVVHIGHTNHDLNLDASVEAVKEHLAPRGAIVSAGPFESVKVSWPLPPELPLVSIIVPTKDKVELLRACVESVLNETQYHPYELLIVDNASVEERTLAYLGGLQQLQDVRILTYPGPYNFSAINNCAARAARGSYLCLLNNDTEALERNWLNEMMRYAVRPEIGAVGAKLLYGDGSIQHAGVIVGIGEAAGHAHRNLPSHERGYFGQVHLTHYVSAVTGACLLVDKRKFFAVGGLDENFFPVAFNDVDFCLKLERLGWRNVYVPHAVMRHHESKSRGKDHTPSQIDRYRRELKNFQDRWGSKTYDDPLLNPNLDRSSETFLIRF